MRVLDYGRSFLGSKASFNSVRFWVESHTQVIDERTQEVEDFYQCGACKSEDTFARKDLFQKDNYDFTPIFGTRHTVIFRRKAWLNPNYRTLYPPDQPWGGTIDHLVYAKPARLLKTNAAILRATVAGLPLVAQVEIRNARTQLRVIIEFPVKTMNIEREREIYQVDTGPLAWPDLSRRRRALAEGLRLAFVAFNVPHFADFVIEAPTPVRVEGRRVAAVHHYSRRVSLRSVNRLYAAG